MIGEHQHIFLRLIGQSFDFGPFRPTSRSISEILRRVKRFFDRFKSFWAFFAPESALHSFSERFGLIGFHNQLIRKVSENEKNCIGEHAGFHFRVWAIIFLAQTITQALDRMHGSLQGASSLLANDPNESLFASCTVTTRVHHSVRPVLPLLQVASYSKHNEHAHVTAGL